MVNSGGRRLDAVLLVSFGGPEGPSEVMPFLRRVTAGRSVPQERLVAVAEQYLHFGGVSPINSQNRALRDELGRALVARGLDVPVYLGNRHWHPLVGDVVPEMARAGHREIAVIATSGFASAPGCRQYRVDVATAIEHAGVEMEWHKIKLWFDEPLFARVAADLVVESIRAIEANQSGPGGIAQNPVIVYSTHSLPTAVAAVSGPVAEHRAAGGAYVAQHRRAAAAITKLVSDDLGRSVSWELVFQSRSGSPRTPWLEPDINQRLPELAQAGAESVVIFPLGFATDHMEIKWDLDVRAKATAAAVGLHFVRARTVGTDPRFAQMLAAMVGDLAAALDVSADTVRDSTREGTRVTAPLADTCPPGCCTGDQPS